MGSYTEVDLKDWKKLQRDLRNFKSKALPYAERAYANNQAFEAQTLWRKELPGKMKLRTKYTVQSIRVDKATSLSNPMATVGSTADYMDEQEYGATQNKKGTHGVPIPAAAKGKRNSSRGRLSKARQFKSIRLLPRISGHRSKQVMASMAMAKKRGAPAYAFLRLGKGKKGLYKLDPSKKRAAIRKVWDLSKSSITIPKNPTLGPAVGKLNHDKLWRDALLYQLRRHRILGY